MKVALYARVSKEEKDRQNAKYQEPLNQLQPLRTWAKQLGYDIVHEYVDRGSGAKENPEFKRLFVDSRNHEFSVLLIWAVDRFSREGIGKVFARLQELKENGVAVKSHQERWLDTSKDNPMIEPLLAILAWVAQQERRRLSERIKASQERINTEIKEQGFHLTKAGKKVREVRFEKSLSVAQVEALRKARQGGKYMRELAEDFGISISTVNRILNGYPKGESHEKDIFRAHGWGTGASSQSKS